MSQNAALLPGSVIILALRGQAKYTSFVGRIREVKCIQVPTPAAQKQSHEKLLCVCVFLREIWAQKTVLKTVFFGWSHVT